MAEFAMDMIEQHIQSPKFYIRYVDDCLAAFNNEDEATTFLDFLNSHHNSLKFTMERVENNQINFLDMTIYTENNCVKTKWYVKPTNTLLYTHRLAFSPTTYKHNAIKALYTRSQKLTTEENEKQHAKEKVVKIFQLNGYSENEINKVIEKSTQTINNTDERKSIFWKLPFVKQCHSETKKKVHYVNKILKRSFLRIAFTTYKTQNIFRNKDPITIGESSSLVYKYTCEQCQACYIGETQRQLNRRITEHLKGRPISEISLHQHPPTAQNFKIIARTHYTKTAESLLIKKHLREGVVLINNNQKSEFLALF